MSEHNAEGVWMGDEQRGNEGDRRSEAHTCFLHKEAIDKIEQHVDSQRDRINTQDNFVGQAKIVGMIMAGIYLGNFIYTYNHIQSSERTFQLQAQGDQKTAEMHRMLIDSNKDSIQDTRGDYKALIVKLDNLTREIQKSNNQNGRLIDALLDDKAH